MWPSKWILAYFAWWRIQPPDNLCYPIWKVSLASDAIWYFSSTRNLPEPLGSCTFWAWRRKSYCRRPAGIRRRGDYGASCWAAQRETPGVASTMQRGRIRLQPEKFHFQVQEVTYWGHIFTSRGLKPDPEKIRAITSMAWPETKQEVRRYVGRNGQLPWTFFTTTVGSGRTIEETDEGWCNVHVEWKDTAAESLSVDTGSVGSSPCVAIFQLITRNGVTMWCIKYWIGSYTPARWATGCFCKQGAVRVRKKLCPNWERVTGDRFWIYAFPAVCIWSEDDSGQWSQTTTVVVLQTSELGAQAFAANVSVLTRLWLLNQISLWSRDASRWCTVESACQWDHGYAKRAVTKRI